MLPAVKDIQVSGVEKYYRAQSKIGSLIWQRIQTAIGVAKKRQLEIPEEGNSHIGTYLHLI